MVKIIAKENIEEILSNPQNYVNSSYDLPLVDANNHRISLGYDKENGMYYIAVFGDVIIYPNAEHPTLKCIYDYVFDSLMREESKNGRI